MAASNAAEPRAARLKPTETWTMRIIEPGAVSDVVLEAESSAVTSAAPFGLWKTTNTVTTATAAKAGPSPPPMKRPAQRAARQATAKQPKTSVSPSEEPMAKETPDPADDASQAAPPDVMKPKDRNAVASAVAGAVAKKSSNSQIQSQPSAAAQ